LTLQISRKVGKKEEEVRKGYGNERGRIRKERTSRESSLETGETKGEERDQREERVEESRLESGANLVY